jgi:hypothetical protein
MLFEVTSDYMRFVSIATLTAKKDRLFQLNNAVAVAGLTNSKPALKTAFLESFVPMLEILVDSDFDDQRFNKAFVQRYKELFKDKTQQMLWSKIVSALELDDLQTWTRDVIEKRAAMYKQV